MKEQKTEYFHLNTFDCDFYRMPLDQMWHANNMPIDRKLYSKFDANEIQRWIIAGAIWKHLSEHQSEWLEEKNIDKYFRELFGFEGVTRLKFESDCPGKTIIWWWGIPNIHEKRDLYDIHTPRWLRITIHADVVFKNIVHTYYNGEEWMEYDYEYLYKLLKEKQSIFKKD